MLIRIVNGLGVTALLAALACLLSARTEPEIASASSQLGERWYRLTLDDRHVGYLHTLAARDLLGRWRFASDLRFLLTPGKAVSIRESLTFDGAPPHALTRARRATDRAGERRDTVIRRHGDGYRTGRGSDGSSRPVDLDFTLADHLSFEVGLEHRQPRAGATIAAFALDLDRSRVVSRQFRVTAHDAPGYRLEHAAASGGTRIQLDEDMQPVAMSLAGLFELEQAPKHAAVAKRAPLQSASYRIPADRPLPAHTRISALALEVRGASAAEVWPSLVKNGLLHRSAGAVSTQAAHGDELQDTATFPASHPRVRALAREAVAGVDDAAGRVAALTEFVNGYIRYRENERARDVLALLDDPAGNCTEYANLLTTLGRSLDIPTRTVFGLAYADQGGPAFRFHAWNELRVDGEWQVVDPTWNQLRVDATHLPLPGDATQALRLLTGDLDLSFAVRDVEYFEGDG
ncbi:MAG: transglutaminase-like domain-containing protein [Pseudomonadota bacterium]